jgi:hypothetical protein
MPKVGWLRRGGALEGELGEARDARLLNWIRVTGMAAVQVDSIEKVLGIATLPGRDPMFEFAFDLWVVGFRAPAGQLIHALFYFSPRHSR